MKSIFKVSLSLIALTIFAALLTGCADISKSKNYKSYELTFLANLTNVAEEDQQNKLNELEKVLKSRLNKFQVSKVSLNQKTENDLNYITVSFGTIDDVNEIKGKLLLDNKFTIKKDIKSNVVAEETASEDETTDEEEAPIDETTLTDEKVAHVEDVLQTLLDGVDFDTTAQNEALSSPENIVYSSSRWMYKDEIKGVFADKLVEMENGEIYTEIIRYKDGGGMAPVIEIASIIKLFEKEEVEKITEIPKTVEISHILITYNDETRTKEEAETLGKEILEKLNNDDDFATLAIEYSEDPTNSVNGGKLPPPAGLGIYVPTFESAALNLEEEGELSELVETEFGFHIIKADKVNPADEDVKIEERFKFGVIFYASVLPKWEVTKLNDEHIKNVEIKYDEAYDPYIIITFSKDGSNMLEEITASNKGRIVGIFIGNQLLSSFTAKDTNQTGTLEILKPTTSQEADEIYEILTTPKLPLPIVMVDDQEIGADDQEEE